MRRLFDTHDTVAEILTAVPPSLAERFAEAAEHFAKCLAGRDVDACGRLPTDAAGHCRVESGQIRARLVGESGWFMSEAMLAMCVAVISEADCRRYGQAVDTGDPSLCIGVTRAVADCPALAAGTPELCARIPTADRSCAEQAANLALLRRGVRQLLARPGRYQPYVRGALEGPASCQSSARAELSAAVEAAATAPQPSPVPPPAEPVPSRP